MNLQGIAECVLPMIDTADRRADVEHLLVEMTNALALAKECVARIDLDQTQRIIGLSWAARQAGRRLGVRVDVTSEIIRAHGQVRVHVKVASPLH